MAENFAVAIEGLDLTGDIEKLDEKIVRAARMAVNDTIRTGRQLAAREMEKQVAFPRGYLTGQEGRLGIAKFASDRDLSGIIRGRDRPTSLARFIVGNKKPVSEGGERGITVQVEPGKAKFMPSAFVIRLRNNNLGLAFHSKDGKKPNSVGAKRLSKNTWLLFGPSVDQVFRGSRVDLKPDLEEHMKKEFERLLEANI